MLSFMNTDIVKIICHKVFIIFEKIEIFVPKFIIENRPDRPIINWNPYLLEI